MSNDWKQIHANESDKAWMHPIVQDALEEARRNLKIEDGSLENLALVKIAAYTAQVARAQALGFDPEALRLTPNEANAAMLKFAAEMVFRGKPTTVIDPDEMQ